MFSAVAQDAAEKNQAADRQALSEIFAGRNEEKTVAFGTNHQIFTHNNLILLHYKYMVATHTNGSQRYHF